MTPLVKIRQGVASKQPDETVATMPLLQRAHRIDGVAAADALLEIAAAPADAHHRAAFRKRAVFEVESGARALQQGFRDEEAKPQAARSRAIDILALRAPAGHIGLADPVHDLRRKAWTVVGNADGNVVPGPGCRHIHPLTGEVHGVFEQVAEAIEDRRIAAADRLGGIAGRQCHVDRHPEIAVRSDRLLDQGG